MPQISRTHVSLFSLLAGCYSPSQPIGAGTESNPTSTGLGPELPGTTSETATESLTSIDDTNSANESTTPSDDDGASTTDPSPCSAATHTCAPLVPPKWNGPVGVIVTPQAEPAPTCAGDYPDFAMAGYTDFHTEPATCGCACDPPANAACSEVLFTVYSPTDDDCSNPGSTWSSVAGCSSTPFSLVSERHWRAEAHVDSGSCVPSPTTELGPAGPDSRVTLCETPYTESGCDSQEQCIPRPDGGLDGRICIWGSGDLKCPTQWQMRDLIYQRVTDTRSCTACTCGSATGVCGGSMNLYSDDICSENLLLTVPIDAGSCVSGNSAATVLSTQSNGSVAPQNPGCEASESTPIGGIEADAPVTLCCSS